MEPCVLLNPNMNKFENTAFNFKKPCLSSVKNLKLL